MSTLWFDIMSCISDDPDWSNLSGKNLAGADRSGTELLSSDDELLDDDPDFYEMRRLKPQYTSKFDSLDNVKSLSGKSLKDFSWLKPPEDWNKNGG